MPESPPAARQRRVLVIAYEFPPSAGSGVARVTKFVKYLRREGWDPVVLTAEPGHGRPRDPALLDEVAGVEVVRLAPRNLVWTLARLSAPARRLLRRGRTTPVPSEGAAAAAGASESSSPAAPRSPLTTRLARWLTFPDEAAPWARSVARVAPALCARRGIDVVLASGPPFSALAAAVDAGRAAHLPVVLDMRDQWRDNVSITWPTAAKKRRAEELERATLAAADAVVCATDGIASEARDMGAREVRTIFNGFDPESVPVRVPGTSGPLRIAFLGRFSRDVMDPTPFFRGLAAAMSQDPVASSVHVDVVGPEAPWVADMVRSLAIAEAVTFHGFMSYQDAMRIVAASDVGLMCVADRPGSGELFPGKLFDYLGVGLPLLFVGPDAGGVARLIRDGDLGRVVRHGDVEGVADAVVAFARAKAEGTPLATMHPDVAARFDRREQVAGLARLLERVRVGGGPR